MIAITLLLAGLSVAVAGLLALVFMRGFRDKGQSGEERDAINLAVAEDNRRLLTGSLDEAEAEEAETEIDVALLADVEDIETPKTQASSRWPFVLIATLIPLLALALYWLSWGRPGTVLLEQAATHFESGVDEASATAIQQLLSDYVALHPTDTKAWISLMSLQWYAGERVPFRETHRAAERLGHSSPFSDSLYLLDAFGVRQFNLTAHDQRIRERLRSQDSTAPVGALLDAIEHTANEDFGAANRAWEDILSQPDLFELHPTAMLGQRATRSRLESATHPQITVDIAIETPFGDQRWLFVYAIEAGGRPPLAVLKRPLTGARRFQLVLDDSVTMRPDVLLSSASNVLVIARLSPTSDVLEQDGDIRVVSAPVNPNKRPRVPLSFGEVQPFVTVKLITETTISPLDSIFIIVKKRAVSAPPVAVRRIFGLPPSEGIHITLADAMIRTSFVAEIEDLVVLGRLSKSGGPIANPGDIESLVVPFERGATVELKLDQTVGDARSN